MLNFFFIGLFHSHDMDHKFGGLTQLDKGFFSPYLTFVFQFNPLILD